MPGLRPAAIAICLWALAAPVTSGSPPSRTLAERDADEVGDVVFGRDSEPGGLGSLGRMIFRTVVKVSDYLQSVSAEATSKRMSGSDLLKR